jgi:hypothetical protein
MRERLINWGRWCRERGAKGHCASIENRYRAPRGAEIDWETATPPAASIFVDVLDAERIEDLVLAMFLQKHHTHYAVALRLNYARRWDHRAIAKKLHCRLGEVQDLLMFAQITLQRMNNLHTEVRISNPEIHHNLNQFPKGFLPMAA